MDQAPPMIRVAIVDDHPAVRLGLAAALSGQPDLEPAGSVGSSRELAPLLYRTRPDVVLLDYHLPGADGLTVCRRIKADVLAPAVLLYSAFADDSMIVPAIIAGADGVLDKGAPPRELYANLRRVACGERALPPVSPALVRAASEALDPADLPILGMLVDCMPPAEVAADLRIERVEFSRRLDRMLARINLPVPAQTGPRPGAL